MALYLLCMLLFVPCLYCQTTGINKQLLDKFNEIRRAEKAADMKLMTWSSVMEALAGDWVQKCNREAPTESSRKTYGQNIFVCTSSTAKTESQYYLEAIDYWAKQKSNYDFNTRKCSNDKCKDYLQVVWADSDSVGCAFKHCNEGTSSKSVFVSCYFKPGGAFPDQEPYIKSEPCGACPQKCNNGLCE